ncbi:hypothetical protein MVEN_00877900 [Mycena venus]|uniref:Reverse transcriptase n=1 Tax=Mycena venus TaxID=2733690 RepID=A0A8H7D451_9AGAR|nr:hypothetical protein MVEN_00877900 [Mycena venus]
MGLRFSSQRRKTALSGFCVDYRGLNRITKKDRYPLPLIADLLDAPGKACIYTKLDLRHAYHLLRIAPGDEPKTAFRTCYGSYHFQVVLEGLTNAPAAFQRFLNSIFANLLDVNVIVYLDDILVYSDDPSQHMAHVREVLRWLREAGLYCKLPKCEFTVTTCEYLGYILLPDGFRMVPEKISAVLDWPVPRKIKDIQSFLGFYNFYCRFIWNYSDITIPLTRLTQSNVLWDWSATCQKAFNTLKKAFTEAPVLSHWIPGRQITVETNASDYAITSILSITGDDGDIHPVAFRSRSLGPSELDYDTHDKELLVIFNAFMQWRHYLEGSTLPIDVVMDHKNLKYFATTKVLTRRQVRWSEYLCHFNMVIRFRPGKLGGKPNALTRRWDVYPKEGDRAYGRLNLQNFRPIFTQDQLTASLRATLLEGIVLQLTVVMDVEQLHTDIKSHMAEDPAGVAGITAASSGQPLRWSINSFGMLRYDDRIWGPNGYRKHSGRPPALVRCEYTWPELRKFVRDYCKSCIVCKCNKAPRHHPYGLLKPLPVPLHLWHSISMDFIEQLPMSMTGAREFILAFFWSLAELLSMEMHFTSGYHSSADGQSERMNQTVEQYIQIFCAYQQDDWDKLLPLAEFALNNAPNASTGVSPFFANKGYNLAITVHPEHDVANISSVNKSHSPRNDTKETGDRVRAPDPGIKVGDQVFVSTKYINTTRPTKKFTETFLGPYEVIRKPSAASYTIRLPKALAQIHPVFHVSQLEPHFPNPFPGQEKPPPAVVEIIDGDEHFEVKQIVDSKIDRRYRTKLQYLVKWPGYENTDEQFSWVSADDIDAPDHIENFHRRYPNKPGPTS